MRTVLMALSLAALLGPVAPAAASGSAPAASVGSPAVTSAASGAASARIAPSPGPTAEPLRLAWTVISRRPHDPEAWTQGLQLDSLGRLFESTGLEGRSTVREVDPVTGSVIRSVALPDDRFGEGLALVDDHLIQLTWRDGVAIAWDTETFDALERFPYEGEGWGLCHDGDRLVMSDGSERLTFRDPGTFEVLGDVAVTLAGEPLGQLNELECVDGDVWANVWLTDRIVRIDPDDGEVTGILDLAGILAAEATPGLPARDVLNGIAWDARSGTFLVTGKLWPELIEIRVDGAVRPTGSPSP